MPLQFLKNVTPEHLFSQAIAQNESDTFLMSIYRFLQQLPDFSAHLPNVQTLISRGQSIVAGQYDGALPLSDNYTFYISGQFGARAYLYEQTFTVMAPPDFDLVYDIMPEEIAVLNAALFLHIFREQRGVVSAICRFDQLFSVRQLHPFTGGQHA